MPKDAVVTTPVKNLPPGDVDGGKWRFIMAPTVGSPVVVYSDTPNYTFKDLPPGIYDFSVVRMAKDSTTQTLGDTFTVRKEVKADVVVQVADGIDVQIVRQGP